MEKLPIDILDNILDRLPTEPALRAKQVCETWRNLLRHKTDKVGFLFTLSYPSYFPKAKNQVFYGDFNRGELNYRDDAVDGMDDNEISIPGNKYIDGMLGSCNGLVCFRRQPDYGVVKPFLLCNPLTRETVYVPYTYCGGGNTQMSGFGYCHTTSEYKIVRMYLDCSNDMKNYYLRNKVPKNYHVQVYTVGDDGWRYKSVDFEKTAKSKSIRTCPVYSAGVYTNGAIHWLHESHATAAGGYTIASFDVEDENFKFIQLPPLREVWNSHPLNLLGGSNLYLVCTNHYEPYHCTDIWAYKKKNTNTTDGGSCGMKQNYKDMNSWHWIKEFRIEWEQRYWRDLLYVEPLGITRNNEFIFHFNGALYCYDLNTSTLYTLLDGRDVGSSCMINVILHANSIVSMSLKDLKEV